MNQRLELAENAVISGRVLDRHGDPVERAAVELNQGEGFVQRQLTNDRGEYRMGGVLPGSYFVRASPAILRTPIERRSDGSTELHYAQTFYPGTTDSDGASRVELRPGQKTEGIDIRLLPYPILRVSGVVTGQPPGPCDVTLNLARDGGYLDVDHRLQNGRFTIWRLSPGRYNLFAQCGNVVSAPVEFEVATTHVEGLELTLIAPFTLRGRLVWERRLSDEKFLGMAVSFSARHSGQSALATAEGTFVWDDIFPARYWVEVGNGPPGTFVKSVRVGTQLSDGVASFPRDPGAEEVVITLATDGAQVSGVVEDAKGPIAGVMLALVPLRYDGFPRARFATTGSDGRYRIDTIPPGDYRLPRIDSRDRHALGMGSPLPLKDTVELSLRQSDKQVRDWRP